MKAKAKLGELLVEAGVIDAAQLQSALGEQRKWGRPLGMTLVRMGFLDEDTLIQTLAAQLKLPVVKLAGKRVNRELLERVPRDMAEKHRCIPLLLNDEGGQKVLYLAMEDPCDLDVLDQIGFRLDVKVKPVLVAPSELSEAIERHYAGAAVGHAIAAGKPAPMKPAALDAAEPEFIDAAPAAPMLPKGPPQPRAVPPAAILRALGQLLVEKGVITRDELIERVSDVMREDDGEI